MRGKQIEGFKKHCSRNALVCLLAKGPPPMNHKLEVIVRLIAIEKLQISFPLIFLPWFLLPRVLSFFWILFRIAGDCPTKIWFAKESNKRQNFDTFRKIFENYEKTVAEYHKNSNCCQRGECQIVPTWKLNFVKGFVFLLNGREVERNGLSHSRFQLSFLFPLSISVLHQTKTLESFQCSFSGLQLKRKSLQITKFFTASFDQWGNFGKIVVAKIAAAWQV